MSNQPPNPYGPPDDSPKETPPSYGQPPYQQPGYSPTPPATSYPQPNYEPYTQPGQPQPDYYGQQGYGMPSGGPQKTNGLAIASLITSLCGFITCGLSAIVGLILGIVSLTQIKKRGDRGFGLALAGTIVGGVLTAGFLIYLIFIVGVASTPEFQDSFQDGFEQGYNETY